MLAEGKGRYPFFSIYGNIEGLLLVVDLVGRMSQIVQDFGESNFDIRDAYTK